MPDPAEVDRLVLQLGDVDDLGETLDALDEWVFDRRAETPRQCQEAFWRQILVTEEDHEVIEQRLTNRTDRRVGQLFREIDAAQLGAKRTGDRLDLERHVAHALPPASLPVESSPAGRSRKWRPTPRLCR